LNEDQPTRTNLKPEILIDSGIFFHFILMHNLNNFVGNKQPKTP